MKEADLPLHVPLFPLPDVVLFPGALLPLHVFEPRYRTMVENAQRQREPLVGMVLLREGWQADYYGCPEIFSVGCAGGIIDVTPLPDGRYNILLSGFREFVVRQERRDLPYRVAEVEWWEECSGDVPDDLRRNVLRAALAALRRHRKPPRWISHLNELPSARLVNLLSFVLPLHVLEKQALLEARPLLQRAERLRQACEFHLCDPWPWSGMPLSRQPH